MNELEERLRRDLAAAVAGVEAPDGLAGAAARGGRRRARRRRALLTAPAAAVVVVAGAAAVQHGLAGGRLDPTVTLTPAPAVVAPPPSPPPPVPTRAERAAAVAAAAEAPARAQLAALRAEAARSWAAQGQEDTAAFFAAGYDTDEAVDLAALWDVGTDEAKATAGRKLSDGESLPVVPRDVVSHASPGWEVAAFQESGYTREDADALARVWGLDAWEAQVEGGERLLAGDVLPVPPSGPTAP